MGNATGRDPLVMKEHLQTWFPEPTFSLSTGLPSLLQLLTPLRVTNMPVHEDRASEQEEAENETDWLCVQEDFLGH